MFLGYLDTCAHPIWDGNHKELIYVISASVFTQHTNENFSREDPVIAPWKGKFSSICQLNLGTGRYVFHLYARKIYFVDCYFPSSFVAHSGYHILLEDIWILFSCNQFQGNIKYHKYLELEIIFWLPRGKLWWLHQPGMKRNSLKCRLLSITCLWRKIGATPRTRKSDLHLSQLYWHATISKENWCTLHCKLCHETPLWRKNIIVIGHSVQLGENGFALLIYHGIYWLWHTVWKRKSEKIA